MKGCFLRSSGRKLLQYIFTIPALMNGAVLALCLTGSSRADLSSPFLFILLPFGFMACLMSLIYGGRFAEITGEGTLLSVYKPYALSDQQQSIDLSTVDKVYFSGTRVQDKYLSFYGKDKDERALLMVRIVPLSAEDLATFAAFLHGQGIATNF